MTTMPLKRRPFSIFTLSFLDVMCCGFGAVVLLFMILKHEAIVKEQEQNVDLSAEVALLEQEITAARAGSSAASGDAEALEREIARLISASAAAAEALKAARANLKPQTSPAVSRRDVEAMKAAILKLETEKRPCCPNSTRSPPRSGPMQGKAIANISPAFA